MGKFTKVIVGKDVTVGVGKYESVKVTAHVEIEVGPTEDHDRIFKSAYDYVDARLNEQLADLQDIVKSDSVFLLEKPKSVEKRRRA